MQQRKKLIFTFLLFIIALLLLVYNKPEKKAEYLRTEGVVFGTTYHITYASPCGINLDTTITRALKDIDFSLSMLNEQSTISRINHNDTTVVLDSLFITLFHTSQQVSEHTQGDFDSMHPCLQYQHGGQICMLAVIPSYTELITSLPCDSVFSYVSSTFLHLSLERRKSRRGWLRVRFSLEFIFFF